jgi:nicotinamide-nucleotide amidase
MRKAYILNIGDELLIGQIINTNAQWLSEKLTESGIEIVEQRVIADNKAQIMDALNDAHKISNIVLITGGLGPTKDDITKSALAEFFETKLVFNEDMYARIQRIFQNYQRKVTHAHKEQCYLPESAELMHNKLGTAPGMILKKGNVLSFSMPGVPYEMKNLMDQEVLPRILELGNDKVVRTKTLLTVGKGESEIAKRIEEIENALPPHIKLAYLPNLGQVRLRLTGQGQSGPQLMEEIEYQADLIKSELGSVVFGEDNENLALVIQKYCAEKGCTLGTAESCTGGSIARMITQNPGSSSYFKGTVVAYANEVKQKLLKVPSRILTKKGAVSEETVQHMVKGVVEALNVDVGLASSGIAGPGGGSRDKPVGTVWLACGNNERIITQKLKIGKDRSSNIEYSSIMALNLLRHFLMDV